MRTVNGHILKECDGKCGDFPCPICEWGAGICVECNAAEIELDEPCKLAKVGWGRICKRCGKTKAPRGRSISPVTWSSYCTNDQCEGYYEAPKPGDLWVGETKEEFGFPCIA